MAIQTALWALQQAVFRRLSEDPKIIETTTGVFDAVEEDLVYPYITLGEPTSISIGPKNSHIEEISITVHAWSVYDGKKEAYDILNNILQAIGKGLSLEGPFTMKRVEKPEMNVLDDIDPRLKHGITRFKFIIKNN